MENTNKSIVIIGAGPVGLAAAAHFIERGEDPLILEAGEAIGHNVRSWAHVRLFSPWEFTVDTAAVRLLEQSGWEMPPLKDLPTGGELVERYLQPLANLDAFEDRIHFNSKVTAISRRHVDKLKDKGRENAPFIVQTETGDVIEAHAVIDASGTWSTPNPLGAHGLPARGEKQHQDRIFYGIPDVLDTYRDRYANKAVLVVGAGHSAINAMLELAELREDYPETQVFWAMRGTNMQKVYGGETDDALPARGALGTRIRKQVENGAVTILSPFYLSSIGAFEGRLCVESDDENRQSVIVDEIIGATGARPNLDMVRELRLGLDSSLETTPALAPMIDPNIHSCGTVRPHGEAELRHPESNFYMIGMKSYGRATSFLLATGYEQARSVAAYLTGDYEAAREVQLCLPETGVCSTDFADDDSGAACCGTPAQATAPISLDAISIPVNAPVLETIQTGKPSCC